MISQNSVRYGLEPLTWAYHSLQLPVGRPTGSPRHRGDPAGRRVGDLPGCGRGPDGGQDEAL